MPKSLRIHFMRSRQILTLIVTLIGCVLSIASFAFSQQDPPLTAASAADSRSSAAAKLRMEVLGRTQVGTPLRPREVAADNGTSETSLGDALKAMAFDGMNFNPTELKGVASTPEAIISGPEQSRLALGRKGDLTFLGINGVILGKSEANGALTGLAVRDKKADVPPMMATGEIIQQGGKIRHRAWIAKQELLLDATYEFCENYLQVAGTISDAKGKDRVVTVYFILPLSEGRWLWWQNLSDRAITLDPQKARSTAEKINDSFPCSAMALPGKTGVSLAVAPGAAIACRFGYSSVWRRYYAAVDLHLIPSVTPGVTPGVIPAAQGKDAAPGEAPAKDASRSEAPAKNVSRSSAPFQFAVYGCDPEWGLRSAVQKYHAAFPDFSAWPFWGKSIWLDECALAGVPISQGRADAWMGQGCFSLFAADAKALKASKPLLAPLSSQPWAPVTNARITPAHLRLERFGSSDKPYLLAYNPDDKPIDARITVDAAALGFQSAFIATPIPTGEKIQPNGNEFTLPLEAKSAALVQLSASSSK
ncbi:MAG: hypothetical protein NTX50_16065 [Candidatus Sumerlaeota bacterium]|nr:hypothetical protein [Candidatus Sumerlaeota bacterium]